MIILYLLILLRNLVRTRYLWSVRTFEVIYIFPVHRPSPESLPEFFYNILCCSSVGVINIAIQQLIWMHGVSWSSDCKQWYVAFLWYKECWQDNRTQHAVYATVTPTLLLPQPLRSKWVAVVRQMYLMITQVAPPVAIVTTRLVAALPLDLPLDQMDCSPPVQLLE